MKILKEDSFRSKGNPVNKSDDMTRVTLYCIKQEVYKLKSWIEVLNNLKSQKFIALEDVKDL